MLSEGLAKLPADDRPRMFGEDAIWYQKRGAARVALGMTTGAEDDLRKSLAAEGRRWVHGRAHLELGRLATKSGNKAAARPELRTAVTFCESDNDQACANDAKGLLR